MHRERGGDSQTDRDRQRQGETERDRNRMRERLRQRERESNHERYQFWWWGQNCSSQPLSVLVWISSPTWDKLCMCRSVHTEGRNTLQPIHLLHLPLANSISHQHLSSGYNDSLQSWQNSACFVRVRWSDLSFTRSISCSGGEIDLSPLSDWQMSAANQHLSTDTAPQKGQLID